MVMVKRILCIIVILALVAVTSASFLVDSWPAVAQDGGEMTFEIPQPSGGSYMLHQSTEGRALGPHSGQDEVPLAPAIGTAFEGFNFDDNGVETGGWVFIPPDPIGAAGADRLIAVVNVMIEARDKTGTLLWRDALKDFFMPLTPANWLFDPKVIYDHYENRFLVVALEHVDAGSNPNPSNTSRILLAVSKTAMPATATSADWYYAAVNSEVSIGGYDFWADYPGFEVDEEAVYITSNMFAHTGYSGYGGVRLWIVDKGVAAGFYGGGAASVTRHNPYAGSGIATTTMPAEVYGTGGIDGVGGGSGGTYLVSYSGLTDGVDEYVQVVRVDNPLGTPTFTQTYVMVGDIEDFLAFPDAPQLGSATDIETNDRRALDAVWRNNRLWLTTTIVPKAGPDMNQTTAHWFKLNASAWPPTLGDQGDIGGEDIAAGTYTYFPSLAVNNNGDAAFGFCASAATIYAGAYCTVHLAGDAPGTVRASETVRVGDDYYVRTFGGPRNRWGDYTGAALDPTDENVVWLFNQYAMLRGSGTPPEDGRWGTAWASTLFTTVTNTPPQVTNVTASQSSPTVDISYDVTDAEQSDVTISFEYWDGASWQACTTTTGEGTQSTGTGKSGTWDAKADFDEHYMTDCRIKVTANDEQTENNIGTGESSAFILDTKDPTGYGCSTPADGAIDISINPNLTCLTASDDSLPVSYYFQLAEDGAFSIGLQESGWQGSTSWSPSTLDHNKQYFWRMKAKDSYDNETDYSSTFDFTTEAVPNTPPVLSNGQVNPDAGWVTTDFTYSVIYTDDDDDPPISITVTIDGGMPQDMTEVDPGDTDYTDGKDYEYIISGLAKDTAHTYQFAASDGVDDAIGDTGSHDGPTVQNVPPTAPVIDVTPDLPLTTDDLVCTITTPSTDPDAGDTITYSYAWYKDDVLQPGLTTDTVASSNTTQGEVWRCVVTPHDGTADGPTDEDEVIIQNTPPEVSSVSATQRSDGSGIVDISYNVSDNEQATVDVSLEYWDPIGSWHSCTNTAGDVGPGINTGTGKAATWNAKAQLGAASIASCKVRVTASDGAGGSDSEESNIFDLDTTPPTGYGCASPENEAECVSIDEALVCSTASDDSAPIEYKFAIASDVAFSQDLQESGWQQSTTWTPTTALSYGKAYWWRVKARDAKNNESAWSSPFTFVTIYKFDLALKSGWNMISLPLESCTGETDPGVILPDVEVIYTWNCNTTSYDSPSEIVPGKGYWALVFEDVTETIYGTPVEEYQLNSNCVGWHMVGSLYVDGQVNVGSGSVYGSLYHWNPETLSYIARPLDDVRPGEGYWLLAFTDFSISVVPKPPGP